MAMTPEKKVKKLCTDILKEEGVYYFSPATFGMGRSGVPDIICCVGRQGFFLAIECKAGKNEPTKLQERELKMIGLSGGVTLVIRETNIDKLKETIQELKLI